MPYPNFYPQYYPPQPVQPPMQQPAPQTSLGGQMSIQNGGFVSVRNEIEARNYPVAYGNSITFKDENAPYVYTKTMGFSQLDRPIFEKYKLVKEEPNLVPEETPVVKQDDPPAYAEKSEIDAIWAEIETIKKSLPAKKKKEVSEDE